MKKILVSLIVTSALVGFTSSAQAGTGTSTHTGDVAGTCSLVVTDGALPNGAGLVSSLVSTTKGKISTVCNTASSALTVELETGSSPTQSNYAEKFELSAGSGAYTTGLPTGFSGATYSKNDLSNGFSSVASTVDVAAQASVPITQFLAAGNYTIKVKATVTP